MTKPSPKKQVDSKMYFYENFAKHFDSVVNMYDTNKRVEVFFSELLYEDLIGRKLLDAGCGTGWFSVRAAERGARVVSMDLGPNLLAEVEKKVNSERVVGSVLDIPFGPNHFDIVVCSEVIEHIPNQYRSLEEFYRVLKPGGILILSTPNKLWYPALIFARIFRLRPYGGMENWSGFRKLQADLKECGFKIEIATGIHAFPFVFSWTERILDLIHPHRKYIKSLMVNIAIRAIKDVKAS